MKKHLLMTLAALLLLALPAHATAAPTTLFVPGYGETGWQTFSYTFSSEFEGNALFVVSNKGSATGNSVLLLDNLSTGFYGNTGFEGQSLPFKGYLAGGDVARVGSMSSSAGQTYLPTEGAGMARLTASGVDTSALGGTTGATLANKFPNTVVFNPGDTWTFNWAFLAFDQAANHDFAKLVLTDKDGNVMLSQTLAQVTPVPGALWLLGSGLVGLVGLRRKLLS